jgi:DMSO/TMAO reductase YedYZ molybdopterin-dependent catalytic subunit
MDITNFTKQQGEFLKAEIVNKNHNALFEISGEAEIVHNEKYDTDRLHIPLKLGESEYTFDCSKTNSRTISEKLGNDTSKWVGKHLVLETYKTKTSDGKMTDAINVKEVK